MEKIKSFTINHDTLEKGLYISRIDNDIITLTEENNELIIK